MAKKIALVAGVLFSIFSCCFFVFVVMFPLKYQNFISKYCKQFGLAEGLVGSLIFAESRYDANAKSKAGASGLMQLMNDTFVWAKNELGEAENHSNIFDPEANIKYGCYYLKYLFDKYHNEIFVLSCYNAGESVVNKWGKSENFSIDNIQYAATKSYVKKILKFKDFYQLRFKI